MLLLSFSQTFIGLTKLTWLDLSDNRFISFSGDDSLLAHSRITLILINNSIYKFKWNESFFDVGVIDLRKNFIKELEIVSNPNKISDIFINLQNNGIRGDISLKFKNLQLQDKYILEMGSNPYECTCSMQNLFQLEENFKQISLKLKRATCSWPAHMHTLSLNDNRNYFLQCGGFKCLMNCFCYFRNVDNHLMVNCSNKDITIVPDLQISKTTSNISSTEFLKQSDKIQLNFENNSIKKLPAIPIRYDYQVIELIASNNLIDEISDENLGDHLKVLDLRNNSLQSLSASVMNEIIKIEKVYLGGNPWKCDCSTIEFFRFVEVFKKVFVDYESLHCDNLNKQFVDLKSIDVCFEVIYIILICGILFGFVGLLVGLFYKYKKDIKIFLYAHEMCLWFVTENELDIDKTYDAFFCFAALDQTLVEDLILDLEKEPNNFKLLVGIRDWPPGHWFPELVSLV